MDDNELIERVIRNNDNSAFAELVNRYQRFVYVTCSALVPVAADVADLVQEVFVELYQSLELFRGESRLSTWLYRIAVNKSLNFLRRSKRQMLFNNLHFTNAEESTAQFESTNAERSADYSINAAENRKILRRAIARLPQNQRIAFMLNKYQELSYSQVAQVMDISVSSVESLLFRAKVNLRKLIAEEM